MLRLPANRTSLGVLIVAAVAVGSIFAAGSGSGRAASGAANQALADFADPANDQAGAAPDITKVIVKSDPLGAITFDLEVENYNTVRPRISFTVRIDADRNAATGFEGAEYLLTAGCQLLDKCGAGLWRWNGVSWDSSPAPSYSSAFRPNGPWGVMHFQVNRSDLGGTTGFDFAVYGYWFVSEPLNYESERAPNGNAMWGYKVAVRTARVDGDRDGVADSRDRCPRARALFDANRNGCAGPFRRMRPDLKFRALGYSSYVTFVSARVEDLPPGAEVEVRCRSACSVRQRQASSAPVVVLTQLHGTRLGRGSVVEIRVVKPGWIGYYARIEIGGSPLTTRTTELCLPASGERATPCNRVGRGT